MTRVLIQLISRVVLVCGLNVALALGIGRVLPPEPELLFSAAYNLSDLNIYRMNMVRQITAAVTRNPANEFSPVWSPDGQHLVYASDRNGPYTIYISDAAGRDEYRLVESEGNQYNPAWSPDGRQIAYINEEKGYGEIMLYDIASATAQSMTDSSRTHVNPMWSPDGKSITFVSDLDERWNTKIYTVDIVSRVITPILVGSATNPIWSPDGRYLLYISGYEKPNLYIWDNNTQKSDVLYTGEFVSNDTPAWSEDGRSIIFAALTANGNYGLFELPVGDCLQQTVTCAAQLLTPIPAFYRSPSWKPTQTASHQ
jgi:Tol biopolymer transport system component